MEAQSTLKQMWDTRPPRIPEDQGGKAVIGGVCEGIGARYQVDPVFVRVLFVVLSLGFGGGVFLYLLCWINMPRFGMTRSPWNAITTPKERLTDIEKKDRSTGWWLLAGLILFFPTASAAGDARAMLVTFILFATGWYFAHQRQAVAPAGLLAVADDTGTETSISKSSIDTSHLTPPEGYPHPGAGQRPPAWDPLGAAPELWHLPDPAEPAPKPEKKRGWKWLPVALIIPVLAITATAYTDPTKGGRYGPIGQDYNLTYDFAEAIPDIKNLAGDIELDLTELEPLEEPKTITIRNGTGLISVALPHNVPVEVHCKVDIGDEECPDGKQNTGKNGELLTINVTQRAGTVSAFYRYE